VGLVSHDLRNPLNTVGLRMQLLERLLSAGHLERPVALEMVRLAQTSLQRMTSMVDELLESTRLESGRVELSLEPVELGGFLEEVVARTVPPEERGRLTLERPPGPLRLPVDPARLERVVVNLLTNALKYCPPDTPIGVRLEAEAGGARVSVRDQGPGISPGDVARLFEKYYRTRTARRAEGLGLGLYISRLVVEAHGGRIWVDSAPGAGSTFSLWLPGGQAGGEAVQR
jgi:NtrC-family two-component system sensor histidine kinase KinB